LKFKFQNKVGGSETIEVFMDEVWKNNLCKKELKMVQLHRKKGNKNPNKKKEVTKVNLHKLDEKIECFITNFFLIFHLCKPNSTILYYLL
jgi:hypothetical protein